MLKIKFILFWVLRGYNPRMSISRGKLLRRLYTAPVETMEQLQDLMAMQSAWLKIHPDDEEVLGVGEMLYMMKYYFEQKSGDNVD